MQKTVELIVSLKVPDNTALTALQVLHNLGFSQIKDLKRADYYRFIFDGTIANFKKKISKVDMIVNANKHSIDFSVKDDGSQKVLVRDMDDDGSGLIALLNSRLGIREVESVIKGVLWSFFTDNPDVASEKAVKELLSNENYQEYSIL